MIWRNPILQLYEQDSFCQEFTSKVISCTQQDDFFKIQLETTAFYPEGGGQPWDTGFLNHLEVTEVHKKEGSIFHYCKEPLEIGSQVTGKIDWTRRFDLMQQHSGEHIVSGIAHTLYACENVGFHMGKDRITIDFDVELTQEQVNELEQRTNQYIWENHPCEISFPDELSLKKLDYRSKKELTGDVRIVSFQKADCCACCGTHVSHSGQVGLVILLSCQKFREGVRIELLCGGRAFQYLKEINRENETISRLLSAKPLETSQAVTRLQKEKEENDFQRKNIEKKYISLLAQTHGTGENFILFVDDLSPDSLRLLAGELSQKATGFSVCVSQSAETFRFALASQSTDMNPIAKELKEKFTVRGGGKPNLIQGTITNTTPEQLNEFFKSYTKKIET